MSDRPRRDEDLRTWIFKDAPAHAPDHLRESVRGEIARTNQHKAGLGRHVARGVAETWRAVAAVVIVAVTITAVGILGLSPGGVGTSRTIPPSFSESPAQVTPDTTELASPAPTPLGSALAGGAVSSTGLLPGATLLVPAGWTLQLDSRDLFMLVRPDAGWLRQIDGLVLFDGVSIYARPRAGQPDGAQQPVDGIGTGAEELATWLSQRPQLVATASVETALAGRTAYRLDIELSSEAGELCGMPCAHLLNGPTPTSYAYGISGPQKARVYLLELPNGDTVMVAIEDVDGRGLESEVDAAQPILNSLAFAP